MPHVIENNVVHFYRFLEKHLHVSRYKIEMSTSDIVTFDFLLLFSKLTPITIHHENSGTRINCQEKDRNLHDFANQG